MSRFGELMTLFSQETERKNTSTIVDFLSVTTMDGGGRSLRRRKSLLGLKSIVCCGSTWGFGASDMDVEPPDVVVHQQVIVDTNYDLECTLPSPRMNLADALAAERRLRSTGDEVGTPLRISLMRLLEETKTDTDTDKEKEKELGRDEMCCVCMGRNKGAALIPCGHTYCRVCCRELWLNRGTCPLCNRSILEILDIY